MQRTLDLMLAATLISFAPACTADLGNCDIDPAAECFKGNSGGSPGITAGTAGTGPSGTAGAGATAGNGGASGTAGAAGTMPDPCVNGVQDGNEKDVDCGEVCPNKCGTGASCNSGADCASDHCFDSVCCDTPCGTDCQECNTPEHPGLCLPVKAGAQDTCADMLACSAEGTCLKAMGENSSSIEECASHTIYSGTCTGCYYQGNEYCQAGSTCLDDYCFVKAPKGQPCQSEAGGKTSCDAGLFCVDGVCCESACSGACMGCNTSYTGNDSGTCAPILANTDPNKECPDGPGGSYCSGADPDGGGNSHCRVINQ